MQRNRGLFGRRPFVFPELGTEFVTRYLLEAQLGSGGGSAVFRAHDTRLDRHVALKILAPDGMDQQSLERFKREALTIARLNHPHIVTIYDFDTAEGRLPYLVLELAEGDDLWSVLYEQNRSFEIPDVVQLALKILDALDYAHQQGVIHRDLKPENVMLKDLNPKITDFGLAYIRGQSRITQEGIISGSAYYISPEVASGKRSDHRVDLYALGVILYEMLAGQLPFYAESQIAVISQHIYDAPTPPSELNPNISPTLEAILLKLLAKNPDERFVSAAETSDALKNLDTEQLTFQIHTPQFLLDRIDRTRLVGRTAEWAQLREAWQKVQFRSTEAHPMVMLIGEAGTGKNQLAQQLMIEARHAGTRIFNTQCYETAAPHPYQPVVEILRDILRLPDLSLPPAMATDLAKLVPDVSQNFVGEMLPPLSVEAERMRLFEHIAQLLINLSEQQALLILIEYLHCTDSSSLSLLHYITRRIRGYPILIVGTYRPSELDHRHPLISLMRDLNSQDLVEQITLRRLSPVDVQSMLDFVFGNSPSANLAALLYEKTQGNIFFTRELLKSLVTEGHTYWDGAAWRVDQLDQIELPNSIRSIISHNLSRLSEAANQALTEAAVIGSEFRFRLLSMISELDEETLADALEAALDAKLIEEKKGVREETYLFANLATHQTLLDTLNQRRQARLHLKIAKALEKLYPHQADDQLETIARHYSLGARNDEDIDRAIDYLEKAASRAAKIFALLTARDLYSQALELSQEDTSPQREARLLRLQERRGLIHQQMGEFAAAVTDLQAVLGLVDADQTRKRAVLIELGQVYRRLERFDSALQCLTEAVAISRQLGDARLIADALFFLGATYWSLSHITQALALQEEAYALVTQADLQDEVAMRVLHGLAEACGRKVDYARLIQLAEDSLRLARQQGNLEYQSENLMIMGTAEIDRGDFERAQAILESDLEICERAGLKWHRMANVGVFGYALAGGGDYQRGLSILREAKDHALEHYRGFLQTLILNNLGRCYLDLEAHAQAAEIFTLGIERAQRHQISWSESSLKAHWAMAQIRMGNLEFGTLLEETLEHSLTSGDMRHVPLLYAALAELEIARQKPQKALKWAENMAILAQQFDQALYVAEAERWRAIALMALGNTTEAEQILEATVEMAVSIRSPRLTWQLHQSLSHAYDYNNKPEEANRARRRVRRVIEELQTNLSDPTLKKGLSAYLPQVREQRSLTTTLRFLVLADAYGTLIRQSIQEHLDEILRCDALILLGDLPQQTYPSLRQDFQLPMRGLCVFGNHDHEAWLSWLPRYNFNHLHMIAETVRIGGQEVTFGGFSGSERYRSGEMNLLQWEEREATKYLKNLPPCDILLTHTTATPPPNFPQDYTHRGLKAIGDYIEKHQPKVALHGHFHANYQRWHGKTQIIGCYGAVLVQCMISSKHDWQVEVQSLLK